MYKGGILSLNQSSLASLDFNSDAYCFTPSNTWACNGDGNSETKMTFVTTSSHLLNAITGLVYESLIPDIYDNITISIYDGVVR